MVWGSESWDELGSSVAISSDGAYLVVGTRDSEWKGGLTVFHRADDASSPDDSVPICTMADGDTTCSAERHHLPPRWAEVARIPRHLCYGLTAGVFGPTMAMSGDGLRVAAAVQGNTTAPQRARVSHARKVQA